MRPVCISYKIYLYKVHKTSGTLAELLLNSYHHYCTRTMSILDISYMAFRHISHHASWDHRGNLKNTPSTVIITRRLGTGYWILSVVIMEYQTFFGNIRTRIIWIPSMFSFERNRACINYRYITYWTTSAIVWIICLAIPKSLDDLLFTYAISCCCEENGNCK